MIGNDRKLSFHVLFELGSLTNGFFSFTDLGLDQYTIKRFDGKVSEL